MIVDIPFLMGIRHMFRKHLKSNRLPNNPCRQITLGIKNITILIGIFIDNRLIFTEKLMNTKVDIYRFWALKIPLCSISDILLSQGVFFSFQQLVFYDVLDFIDFYTLWETAMNLFDDTFN